MRTLDRYQVLFGPIGSQPVEMVKAAAVTYVDALNSPGSATLRIPIRQQTDSAGTSLVTRENLRPRRTHIWIERDNVVVWSGLVWSRTTNPTAGEITITAKGPQSYFRRRHFHTDKTWTGIDQLTIAREIIDHAQAVSGGTIGIKTTDSNTSGVTRTRTYLGRERKNYGEALEQLAAVNNGFDFRFDSFRDPTSGLYEVELRTSYPAQGRSTALVFEHGSNCDVVSVDEDGEDSANYVTATGAGETTSMLLSVAQDVAALNSEPMFERVISHADVTITATLEDHARRELTRRLDDEIVVKVKMHPAATPDIGSYLVGDRVRLIYSDGYEALDRTLRVLTRTVSAAGGSEITTVTLGPVDPVHAADTDRLERETLRRVATLERARRTTP